MIINDIFSGLGFLHENHVWHRDIKPANVILQDGNWKLCDYGLAKYANCNP